MKPRAILHFDINHCFAQIEEMKNPQYREVPMCVGGDEKKRHGIVLARNLEAKKYGVKTAEPLRDAFRKCPHLVVVSPNTRDYIYYSEMIKDIYREYTDKVESFGIDEAWLDVTQSELLFGDSEKIAHEIQNRVLDEFGVTISVGVSFNKIFAKLGSDMVKPSGFTVITPKNYREKVWNLPAQELLFVGAKTVPKLNEKGIFSIGDIARTDPKHLKRILGEQGSVIWGFANGLDETQVDISVRKPKSIGNGTTPPHDIESMTDLKHIMNVLVESVAARLKEQELEGSTISLALRSTNLVTGNRQKKLKRPTNLASEILEVCLDLARHSFDFSPPYRSVTVTVSSLEPKAPSFQLDIFEDPRKRVRDYNLETTIDSVRKRYGHNVIKRCSMKVREEMTDFNPKEDHVIHPVGFYK